MRIQSILLATAGLASLTCAQAARATTVQSPAGQKYSIALPAQSLAESLYAVSRATGVQLVFTERDVLGIQALPLSRSEEHTSELKSLIPISVTVICLNKNTTT